MGLSKQLSEQLIDDGQVHRNRMRGRGGEEREQVESIQAGEVSLRFGGEQASGAGRISWSSLLQGDMDACTTSLHAVLFTDLLT